MKQSARLLTLCSFFVLAFAFRSPAPLIYLPGEGWTYETPGTETGKWQRVRAKDQLEVAQDAYNKKDYDLALKAARRVEKQWPLSDHAPHAQYLIGRCYEAKGNDEKAFNAYQRIIEHNPKAENYQEILGRQYDIAGRYLGGQRFRLWNYVPFFPSMDKTSGMFETIIKNGPYSDVAAQSQLKLGEAREKQDEPKQAIKAYEVAADRYNDRPKIAADALFKTGLAYRKQSKSAEYDQGVAVQSIAALTDFLTLYPDDPRGPEARKLIAALKTQAAHGNFNIAEYYEKKQKWPAALIYYNEVLVQDASSPYAQTARQRIDALKRKLGVEPAAVATAPAPATTTETPATAASTSAPAPATAVPEATAAPVAAAPAAASGTMPPVPTPAVPEPAPAPVAEVTPAPAVAPSESHWWKDFWHLNWLPSAPQPKTDSAASPDEPKK